MGLGERLKNAAKAFNKTKTQRWWDGEVTVEGNTYKAEGIFSIKQLMANLEAQLVEDAAVVVTTSENNTTETTENSSNETDNTVT